MTRSMSAIGQGPGSCYTTGRDLSTDDLVEGLILIGLLCPVCGYRPERLKEKDGTCKLPPFRASGGAPTRHWLRFWVLLLLVPACFALATMPLTVAAVAITLAFGLPFGIWLAVNVHSASAAPSPGR